MDHNRIVSAFPTGDNAMFDCLSSRISKLEWRGALRSAAVACQSDDLNREERHAALAW
jgi:hypothetical protein